MMCSYKESLKANYAYNTEHMMCSYKESLKTNYDYLGGPPN